MTKQSRDSAEKIHVIVQTDDLPVTATQIAKESICDSQLSIVMKAIPHGCWPTDSSVDVNPFYKRRHELSNFFRGEEVICSRPYLHDIVRMRVQLDVCY